MQQQGPSATLVPSCCCTAAHALPAFGYLMQTAKCHVEFGRPGRQRQRQLHYGSRSSAGSAEPHCQIFWKLSISDTDMSCLACLCPNYCNVTLKPLCNTQYECHDSSTACCTLADQPIACTDCPPPPLQLKVLFTRICRSMHKLVRRTSCKGHPFTRMPTLMLQLNGRLAECLLCSKQAKQRQLKADCPQECCIKHHAYVLQVNLTTVFKLASCSKLGMYTLPATQVGNIYIHS